MKLREWLNENGVTNPVFGERIGRTAEAVRRYAVGDRIPDKETMPLIVTATSGEVTPNDFFDIAEAPGAPLTVAACPTCDLRAEAPQVSTCTRADCPMARPCEALAA